MKLFKIEFLYAFALILAVGFASCSDDEDEPDPTPDPTPQTIAQVAAGDAQFSTLVEALDRVNLVATLEGDGPFTVFAPTNDAFEALGVDLSTLSDDELTEILLYHVIGAQINSGDIAEGDTYVSSATTTGPGGKALSLYINNNGGTITVNGGSEVVAADVEASNGVIHVVNQVLLPLDIVGHASANGAFETLVGALGDADGDLVSVLQGDGPFTVFAPTNDAFDKISDVVAGLDAEGLSEVLLYHVLGGQVNSEDIAEGDTYVSTASANGPDDTQLTAYINNDGTDITLNGIANVVVADVVGTNGIIHVINEVIIPLDVVGHATANPLFSELVTALGAADGDLVTTLQGDGPFTVFAPINSAFEEISDTVEGLTPAQLANVLTYHVVSGNVRSAALTNGQVVPALNMEDFTVNISGGDVTITDAQGGIAEVILTDVQGTNGVIHVLNKVILP